MQHQEGQALEALESPWIEQTEPRVQVGQSEKSLQAEDQEEEAAWRTESQKHPGALGGSPLTP